MSSRIINCAVIGLGVGEQHARAVLVHPSAKLSAVCDFDFNKMNSFIKKYNLDRSILKSFEEILEDKKIDLVSIASFDDDHYAQVMACLYHGKHVFVEKPLCQSISQLKEIYTLWEKKQLGLASNLILRKAPLYIWLANAIANDELGKIYAIDMDYLYGRVHKITDGWRANVPDYSVMAGGGIHLIDLMMRFLKQKPNKVQSSVNKIVTANTEFRYHDFHAATFHFEDKTIGRITANFGCVHRHHHVLKIFGTKATFIYDDMGARIHRNRDESLIAETIKLAPKPEDKGNLLMDFISNICKENYTQYVKIEFDLMCAMAASDEAIAYNSRLIDIAYLTI